MIDKVEALTELIEDAVASRRFLEAQVANTRARLDEYVAELKTVRNEEETYRAARRRALPESAAVPEEPLFPDLDDVAGPEDSSSLDSSDWAKMPRTFAVDDALRVALQNRASASPGDVVAVLHEHGRRDSRDEVGSALSYLSRKRVIRTLGRGQWVLNTSGEKSEDTANTVSSDSQQTTS